MNISLVKVSEVETMFGIEFSTLITGKFLAIFNSEDRFSFKCDRLELFLWQGINIRININTINMIKNHIFKLFTSSFTFGDITTFHGCITYFIWFKTELPWKWLLVSQLLRIPITHCLSMVWCLDV